jgi:hypothetical protein
MQSEHTPQRQMERDITVLLRAPLRAAYAEEAVAGDARTELGKWGEHVRSEDAAIRGLTLLITDPVGHGG